MTEITDPFAHTQSTTEYQVLVAPNVFNIRVMLEPTVVFLQKADAMFPSEKSPAVATNNFLENFLVKMFVPQLEDSLNEVLRKIVMRPEAYLVDPQWNTLAKRPVFKGASSFIQLINNTCWLLNTGYLYREQYATLIISLITQFTAVYKTYYQSQVTIADSDRSNSNSPKVKLAAMWAKDDSLKPLSLEIIHSNFTVGSSVSATAAPASSPSTPNSPSALSGALNNFNIAIAQEINFYLGKRYSNRGKGPGIVQTDILDFVSFQSLCSLISSIRWVVFRLRSIRKIESLEPDEDKIPNSLNTRLRKRWTLLEVHRAVDSSFSESKESAALTLHGNSIQKFDKAVQDLEILADLCVTTLRCDVRARAIYYIDRTMVDGDYYLDIEAEQRDNYIGLLDSDLVQCDDRITELVPYPDKSGIFRGLSKLIDELLILGADSLSLLNANGVKKMYCNILVLQQLLKSIAEVPQQVEFQKSLAFYELFNSNPTALLDMVKQGQIQFSYEELKILLKLMYSEIIQKHEQIGRREAATSAKNSLHDQIMQLHNYFWGSDKIAHRNGGGEK